MKVKELILKKLNKNKKIRVSDIVKETGFSRTYIKRFFQQLKKEGKIILIGKANRAHYILAKKSNLSKAKKEILNIHRILTNKDLFEDIILDEIKDQTGIFLNLPKNIISILDYSFTEILNNAIEHSRSTKITVHMVRDNSFINFDVCDQGIGIFKNIMQKRKLKNELEAIQDLLKGKQTTMPRKHTGEGIFFTSKVADKLSIKSHRKKLIFDNQIGDIFIKDIKSITGTRVAFLINRNSKKQLDEIFKEYSEDFFEFSKTKVTVDLYKMGNAYIARSQARRILAGLEKFKTIIFDFDKVETVGQGFADEVFRVWQLHHQDIKIIYQNTNENIEFMIKRAMAEK
jgi:anti-sigma regulatory factor (Ser/Thr protein kinase)/biotin operon repressor